MDTLYEGPRNLGFLLTEAEGHRSRENVVIAAGQGLLKPGTIVGQVTSSKKFAVSQDAQDAGTAGAENAAAVLCYAVDATSADVAAVVVDSDCEVKGPELIYHSTVNTDAKRAAKIVQLRSRNIKVR